MTSQRQNNSERIAHDSVALYDSVVFDHLCRSFSALLCFKPERLLLQETRAKTTRTTRSRVRARDSACRSSTSATRNMTAMTPVTKTSACAPLVSDVTVFSLQRISALSSIELRILFHVQSYSDPAIVVGLTWGLHKSSCVTCTWAAIFFYCWERNVALYCLAESCVSLSTRAVSVVWWSICVSQLCPLLPKRSCCVRTWESLLAVWMELLGPDEGQNGAVTSRIMRTIVVFSRI